MKLRRLPHHFAVRNLIGFLVVCLAHYISDWYAMDHRSGFSRYAPYLFLLSLYAWLVFHNRVLFERFFLTGKRTVYFAWVLLLLALGSFNLHYILRTEFGVTHTLPFLVSYYLYTVTGLGVYVTYRFLLMPVSSPRLPDLPAAVTPPDFTCIIDGVTCRIPYPSILYIESLENYLKVVTPAKTFVTRQTLKEAEERLPRRQFVRISRSHIVNRARIAQAGPDEIIIGEKVFRIGRVYKRYVTEQLTTDSVPEGDR